MIFAVLAVLGLALSSAESKAGVGPITVTPITWNVVGLANNNNNVASGPFEYPAGVRVCNTGSDPATGVSAAWTWVGGINAVSSNLWNSPADNTSQSLGSLAGGACQDIYFDLQVKQVQSNRDKSQQRTITVTSGNAATATNTQYLYVESLVKQNRNSTKKLSGPGGCNITYTVCDPAVTNLYVGDTYTYKFYAQTATAYDELDAFALFPTFTRVTSTNTTYSNITSPGPSAVNRIWSDACTWTGVTGASSGTCTTSGKAGGRLVTTYTVKAISAGTGNLPDLIYDHSGSSFHYNGDWSTSAPILASSFNAYYKLAATVVGNGTVTSNVAGTRPTGGTATINCGTGGTVCDAGYSSGNVTLTATPGAGQAFSGWSGDGSCTGASTCVVTMSQSRSVTATFTGITYYPLYVSKYGSGTVTADSGAVNCGATCNGTYANGTVVTLTASAASGWSFTGWSGACAASATSPTCQVTMSQERDVIATFTEITYTLTLSATGTGAGDLCSNNSNQTGSGLCEPSTEPVFLSCGSSSSTANFGDTICSGTYPVGTSVTIYPMCNGGSAATPCPGGSGPSTVSFGGYTGGTCTGNATTGCTFAMSQNRTVSGNFVVGSFPDLTISKIHTGDFTQGDTGKTYSLTVSNLGTAAGYSGKTITVTDSAPAGLTITAMSGTGWTCTTLPTCTQVLGSNLAAGASLSPITVTVNVASNASTPLVNSATVSCSSSCNNDTTNDTANDSTNVLTPSDLTISKLHSGNFTQGSTGTYNLTVSNTGGQPTSGTVTVTDSLPTGFTKSSFSGTGWDCSASTTSTLTCSRSDALAAVSSYPAIVAVVNVSATAVTATNTATVGGGGESNTANDSSSDPTTVVAVLTAATAGNGSGNVVSDLGSINCGSGGSTCTDSYDTAGGGTVVTLTETPGTGSNFTGWSGACAGASTTCQVTMSQARSVTATFALQTFTLQITTSGAGTGTVTSDVGGISCNQNAGTCSHVYDYGTVVTLSESPSGGSSFGGWSGGCSVSGATCVATMTQARSIGAQFDLGPQPDMTIVKSHVGNFTQGDVGDTYTITATNSGGAASSGSVSVVDTLPSGLTATAISGTGWSCTLGTLTCTRSDALGAGASYPAITVTVDVSATAGSLVTNTATVSGGGETNTSNDTASDPTTVDQLADMTVVKSHTGNFTQGDTGETYTITATNSGTGATSGTVTVTDTLPAGLTATAISGTGWSCTLGTLTCTRFDGLAAGQSYPSITVTVDVSASAGSLVTNTATVSGGGEVVTTNDSTSDPTTVNQVADMTIAKSHTGNFTQGDVGDTYAITATNSGTGATSGTVTVVDTLPAGLTATAISGTGWSCTLGTLTCTRSDVLAAGQSYPAITVTVDVSATADSLVTNTATVSGGGEVVTNNDSTSDPTTVNQLADMTIVKSHTGNFTQGDVGDTYTITATNSGTGATSGTVTVVETLPSGLTATAISGTGWSCTFGTLTCTRSDVLAAGQSYPSITVTVDVSATADSLVTNTATVSGGGEVVTNNDSASDPTTVNQVADMTIAKSHTGNFTQGDVGDTYTITATNSGTGATSGTVTVTDTLPAGLTATALSGTGWSCTLGTLTCTRSDSLAAGQSYPSITVTVDVSATADALVTNTATVSGGGEVVTNNDSTTDPTTIVQLPVLSIAKVHNPSGSWRQGDTGVASDYYTLTVSNGAASTVGPTSGTVTVTDTAPVGLTITAMSGTGWTCTTLPTCTRSDVLAPGNSYPTIKVSVDIASNAAASVTNGASVSGGSCASSPCDSTTDDTSITARYTLTGTTDGTGSGAVTSDVGSIDCGSGGSSCSDTYDDGTVVTLTASPDAGSDFTGWSGACSGSATTCQVTMDQARSVTATFTSQKPNLSVATAGNGSGSVSSDVGGISCAGNAGTCSHAYDYGTVVTLTASPGTGSDFTGWSGACSGSTTTCQVTMDHSRSVTATFILQKRDLSVATAGTGSGSVTSDAGGVNCTGNAGTCGHSYDYGTVVTLTATAATGSDFTGWSGACEGLATTCQVTMDQARSVTATFTVRSVQTASASGVVYHDLDADGTQDSGEPGLQGWQVWIDLNHNGQLDLSDLTAQTASDGSYSFANVAPGTYTVYETPASGWHCSQPNPCQYAQTFTAGQNVAGRDFGNYRLATVRGKMFDDLNRDGKQETGEPGLGGWRIYIDYNNNGEWDSDEPFALTSATAPGTPKAATRALPGRYAITGILVGNWPVRQIRQDGYACTLPFNCAYQETFLEGSVIDNRDFATYKPELAGKAKLQVPQACVRGGYSIRVIGRQITRVTITLSPGVRRLLHGTPAIHQRFAIKLKSNRLKIGGHRVTVRVYFTQASATKSVLLRGVVYRCGKPSAAFTA